MPHDREQPGRQQIYWKALQTKPKIEIIEGYYRTDKKQRWTVSSPSEKILVYETLEKGSDVNLATDFVNDAYQNRYELGIILSDDSDLVNALRVVKKDAQKFVGVLSPTSDNRGQELRRNAHYKWRHSLSVDDLKNAQLSKTIIRKGKSPLSKPEIWL